MKLKAAFRYQAVELVQSASVFCLIIGAIIVVFFAMTITRIAYVYVPNLGFLPYVLMPLLASVMAHSVNADLGEALHEIREQPRAVAHILAEHRRRERELHRQLKARLAAAGARHADTFDLTERCPGGVCTIADTEDDGH